MISVLLQTAYFLALPAGFLAFAWFAITQDRKTKLMIERERANTALEQRRLLEEERRQTANDTLEAIKTIGKNRKDQKEKSAEPIEATDPFESTTVQHALPVDPVSVPEDTTLESMDVFVTTEDHMHA